MKATEKQARYAMILLGKAGYSTRYMNAEFKELGAGMNARSGTVASWLEGMDTGEISILIDRLKQKK